MGEYRMRDLDQIRAVTGTRHPKIMFRIFKALTDEYQLPGPIATQSRSHSNQTCRLLRALFLLKYADRKQVKVKYPRPCTQGPVYAYRRNGRDLLAEEYGEWKQNLETVDTKLSRLNHSP